MRKNRETEKRKNVNPCVFYVFFIFHALIESFIIGIFKKNAYFCDDYLTLKQTYMKKIKFFLLLLCIAISTASGAAPKNESIEKVYVIFKTHLDVGFTDLSSVVADRYVEEFIPKAIEVGERLEADGLGERYVWTTGSWLVWKYLREASAPAVERLEKALKRGDIVWNAVPYTYESETMNRDMFEASLQIAKKLDKKYGRNTIAAKMTDVPGHTRGIIAPMAKAGIRFLHIGVNSACPVPGVPPFCRWRDSEGNEILLVYQNDYGTEDVLPDGKTVLSVNFTGDNHGPHRYEDVKRIYAGLRERYPNAKIVPASFNEVAEDLLAMKDRLPVVTQEIGDTWIYGFGGAPVRMAKYRALSRLYSQWLAKGKLKGYEDQALDFVAELGLIAEHTQGVDVKTHVCRWEAYDMDVFRAYRSAGLFRMAEDSWRELDNYIGSAIAYLPEHLQKEAIAEVAKCDDIELQDTKKKVKPADWSQPLMKGMTVGALSYQMLDINDYNTFQDNYMRKPKPGWGIADLGKPGLENSKAVSVALKAQTVGRTVSKDKEGVHTVSELQFPDVDSVPAGVYPERMQVNVWVANDQQRAEISCTLSHKPAVRLPEAYWLSFTAEDITGLVAEKVGERIDLLDVVEKGNRQQHGIDRYVDLITPNGTFRIWSPDAFLVNVGEPRGLNYSTGYPDKKGGVHFCLFNNLWGTNFSMWWEGSVTYHFTVEKID